MKTDSAGIHTTLVFRLVHDVFNIFFEFVFVFGHVAISTPKISIKTHNFFHIFATFRTVKRAHCMAYMVTLFKNC